MAKIDNIKIVVACHRDGFTSLEHEQFLPIHCGKATSSVDLGGMQGDDTGDNISAKNIDYCELTAQYWAWKNLKNVGYVGLEHYRRHFIYEEVDKDDYHWGIEMTAATYAQHPSTIFKPEMLDGYDIILPQRCRYNRNPYDEYLTNLNLDRDYKVMRKLVIDNDPEHYMLWHRLFECGEGISYKNMFVARWDVFADYSRWLFDFLEKFAAAETEKKVSGRTRTYGFASELLLNLFVAQRGYKVKYMRINFITA